MYKICNNRKMKLVITSHRGTASNNFLRNPNTARYKILIKGEKINTLKKYPMITTVETIACSCRKELKWSATVSRKKKLQTRATLDKNKSMRIS